MLGCEMGHQTEGEEIFCFDQDDHFVTIKSKIINSGTSGGSQLEKEECNGISEEDCFFDTSRLASFEDEEILSIRPKKNYCFDIMQNEDWEPSMEGSNNNSVDLSSMFQNISFVDYQNSSSDYDYFSFDQMTIEGLRIHLQSCFTCGVHWLEEQASLDCAECGGYALSRPCPDCDGKCHATWTRDLDQSHSLGKAKWIGTCTKSLTTA